MKILCLGGGPAGLYFAISMKLRDPSHDVTVLERNGAGDTFGWGVVLSDDALSRLQKNDPPSAQAIRDHFIYWDDIAVIRDGHRQVSGGHGFAGIGRRQLLILLQERARDLGVDLQFRTEFQTAEHYRRDYDLVVACDGLNSKVRTEYADVFRPDIDMRRCKFVWLGTKQKFDDAFTFIFEKTPQGWLWAHVYSFDADTATFIVECAQETWDAMGFEGMTKEQIVETCRAVFADHLGGHDLMSNAAHLRGSAVWMNFPRVICDRWYHENVVLMGDAAATGHFSIGSGTRLALDSAIALADYLHSEPDLPRAFERYQEERRVEVLRLQSAARNSLEWFEEVERYLDLDPIQFTYSLLTRSQRIGHENLRLRDPDWVREAEDWFQRQAGGQPGRAPIFAPFRLRDMALKNRIVVSPMAQYKAQRRLPDRLASGPLRRTRQGRRGAGLYRDDLCQPRRPHHAGLSGPLRARASGGLAADHRFRPCRDGCQDLLPDRPFGPQGLHPHRVGGDGPAAGGGQLADHGGLRPAVVRRQCRAAGDDPRRHGGGDRAVRGRDPHGGCGGLRHDRAARGAWLSAVRVPVAGVEPAHAMTMAAAWRTACAGRWRCSPPCAPSGRRTNRCRCGSRPRTGPMRA